MRGSEERRAAGITESAIRWGEIRGDLIRTVRKSWVEDFQAHSLFEGVRIRLGGKRTPEAVAHPYFIETRSTAKTEKLTDKKLLDLFDGSGGSLLIWGEPGSGKTFTLVQLLALLLQRADGEASAPVPVVAPLSSWAVKQLPLDQWLAPELALHYGLSVKDTPSLLAEGGRLTLLLDGLDEVRADARDACLAAIRDFMQKFRAAIVICCRVKEYEALPATLPRGEAMRILPLTPEQTDKYLNDLDHDAQLAPLRTLLAADAGWRDLASTPLMLSILAYVHAADGGFASTSGTAEQRRAAVFGRYVRLMLLRKERQSPEGGIVQEAAPFTKGQAIHWLQQIAKRMVKAQSTTYYIERMQPSWVGGKCRYLLIGVGFGGAYGWVFGGLCSEPVGGLLIGLATGLLTVLPSRLIRIFLEFRPVETVHLRYDPKELLLGLFSGLILGLTGGLIVGPIAGLIGGLVGGLIAGLFERRSAPTPSRPNQGLRSSIRISLTAAVLVGALGYVIGWHFGEATTGLAMGVWFGLMPFGGTSVTMHYVVRLTLAWEGALPFPLSDRKLVAFLNAMRDRLLLKGNGGGWVFIHRELLDFLATEPFGPTPSAVEQSMQSN